MNFFKELKKHGFLLQYLIARDFKVKYRRSFLGIAWSVLNPLFMMIIVSTVFQHVFQRNIGMEYSYPFYVIIGQSMFNFFSEATSASMQSILISAPLIKKVYIPKYIFPLEKVSFSFVNFTVSMIAVVLVGIWQGVGLSWHVVLVPFLLVTFYFFSLGIGLILSVWSVFFRDIIHIYSIVLTAWMYLTPVFYDLQTIGITGKLATIFKLNPMYQYINVFRDLTLFHKTPSLLSVVLCVAYATFFMVLGVLFFKKKQDKFILHI